MAKANRSRINAFAGIKTDGADEAKNRLTSGKSESNLPASADKPEPAETVQRNKGGRPANTIKREKTVVYLVPENVVAMKTRAVQQGARFSDVIDALIQYHLNDLTDEELEAVKGVNKSKTS